MVVVTAADAKYFRGLRNLVGSVHFWSPMTRISVYDLGLSVFMKRQVSDWRNVRLISGILAGVPEHVLDLHHYAWKPLVIKNALEQEDSILWLDAGSDLRAPLDAIDECIRTDGHFFATGQDNDMTKMSHPDIYRALGTSPSRFRGLEHFAGSVQGYRRCSDAYNRILIPMAEWTLEKECIAPAGSSLQNHRYDQTLLSILIYTSGLEISPKTFMLTAERAQLNENPLKQSAKAVFTARRSSSEYVRQVRRKNGEQAYPTFLRKVKLKLGIS